MYGMLADRRDARERTRRAMCEMVRWQIAEQDLFCLLSAGQLSALRT